MSSPHIVSVNVGAPRTVDWHGKPISTAIWKAPVVGPIRLEGVNLDGDDQADRRVHGGPDKAVYAYAVEDYEWWSREGAVVEAATFGENLTTAGIDLAGCHIGDGWRVGTAMLEVSQPRMPCFKLGIRMSDDDFPLRFTDAQRPGAYLRIVEAGEVSAGDVIKVEPASQPAVSVGELVDAEASVETLALAAADERVPPGWRRTAARALEALRG
jgi:MOSC domain-containing protein YiiM